jgi:hypothetical protein
MHSCTVSLPFVVIFLGVSVWYGDQISKEKISKKNLEQNNIEKQNFENIKIRKIDIPKNQLFESMNLEKIKY